MECCEHITAVGLQEGEKRRKEVEGFHHCHEEACSVNQQNSVQRIGRYEQLREKVYMCTQAVQLVLFDLSFLTSMESYRRLLTRCSTT